jgi:hypothetical protein
MSNEGVVAFCVKCVMCRIEVSSNVASIVVFWQEGEKYVLPFPFRQRGVGPQRVESGRWLELRMRICCMCGEGTRVCWGWEKGPCFAKPV